MRIVHIDTGPEMRGGQHQVLLLLNGLAERGYEQILLAREGGPLWQAAKAAGHRVVSATLLHLMHCSRQSEVLVHAHDARAHTLAAVLPSIQLVVSRRVAFPPKQSRLSQWKYGRAKRYLVVSCFVRKVLIDAGVPSEKIDVIYDGVEMPLEKVSWNPKGPVVALASRDTDKGRDLMEEASALVNVPVLYSNDLARDLQHASLFVYLTRSEGLGSAALLAMSMGVPVIASRVGGLAEVFVHNESGLYVENDARQVAATICHLRGDPDLAGHLGHGGRRRVQECFIKERMIENTIHAYKRVLAR